MKNKAMYELKDLISCAIANACNTNINGKWVPARPLNFRPTYCSLIKRLYFAWQVVLGKAETFTWPEEQ